MSQWANKKLIQEFRQMNYIFPNGEEVLNTKQAAKNFPKHLLTETVKENTMKRALNCFIGSCTLFYSYRLHNSRFRFY